MSCAIERNELALDPRIAARAAKARAGCSPAERQQRADRIETKAAEVRREMSRDDVCNIEPLSAAEAAELFETLDELDCENLHLPNGTTLAMYKWRSGDVRWTMTPHEVRRWQRADRVQRQEYPDARKDN